MTNAIKEIYKWQVDAGNASRPYDDFLEASFQVEEALEGFNMHNLANKETNHRLYEHCVIYGFNPKEVSRAIVRNSLPKEANLQNVDRLDKACDAIIFAIGSMAKLGLTPQEINQALLVVNEANKQKLYSKRDTEGKLGKPMNFVGPEAALQKLLDKE